MKLNKNELYRKARVLKIYKIKRLKGHKGIENIDRKKCIRKIMLDGKLYASKRIYKNILKEMKNWKKIYSIIMNCAPRIIVRRSFSIQARLNNNYEIVPLTLKRSFSYGLKFIVDAARKRLKSGISMTKALLLELKDAKRNQGQAYRKKINIYQQVLANRGYIMSMQN